ncbi:MAG: hypothetical protein J6U54_22860 [Clostridiales bacterium]|nr:hypothetical protein [Clostridiales bacterium]
MSAITELAEGEIRGYETFYSTNVGSKASDALTSYTDGLKTLRSMSFGSDDTSTAHGVINALITEVSAVAETMEEVNLMIDSLFTLIDNEILTKEDQLSKTITGV